MESDKAHGARWELVRLAPSRIVFDVHRHVSRGCHANDTAGISVIGRTFFRARLGREATAEHTSESLCAFDVGASSITNLAD